MNKTAHFATAGFQEDNTTPNEGFHISKSMSVYRGALQSSIGNPIEATA